ncbi:MAG: hypothetical protein F6K50_35780 [Moorea sp. SIO3I7]|nr:MULTISPECIES: hypothetical protein [unclassified Moorena]NEO00614.1 hypothetical protein [Moorena sp. SIO3I7]NEO18642.1 hypothetical protein [Moorena sp. SIO4A5]NEP29441.1 hypothetical protein [Moorena sp. SIO3I6]NEQ56044.1 hypothetical protein [Moorena sp. SIO4A1]
MTNFPAFMAFGHATRTALKVSIPSITHRLVFCERLCAKFIPGDETDR